jgi:glycosyltransferase involved in cell wall biosynthesis
MRFHILARDIQRHDAVGNFCRQMAALLQSKGADVCLAAENCHRDDRSIIRGLLAALDDISPEDMVFFHFSTEDPALPTIATLPNPKVIYFHNITPEHFFLPHDPQSARKVREGLAQRPFAARFDVLMANSDTSARDLHDGLRPADRMRIAKSQIFVCPPVVGIDRWTGLMSASVPLPAVERLVLFVGRLLPHKNVHKLSHGFSILAAGDQSVGLAIVGSSADKAYWHRLVTQVRNLEPGIAHRIAFFENVPDAAMKFLFEQSSVVASMSAHEGFGVPLVDAMVFGKPLVIAAEQGMMETVGEAALVVATSEPDQIAHALAKALLDSNVASRLAAARKSRLAELRRQADGHRILEAVTAAGKAKGRVIGCADNQLRC